MKKKLFDFAIGNPPYHLATDNTSDKPVYNDFMDGSFEVAEKVELITPARFLFNAGKTPKAWNEKMLSDPHFKVLFYEQDSGKIFSNTDIMGGIAITYHDSSKEIGPIDSFSIFPEMNFILKKVISRSDFSTLDDLLIQQNRWNLDALYEDYPTYKGIIGSNGTERRLTTSIFSSLPIFMDSKKGESLKVVGLIKNKRTIKYIDKKYIDSKHENLLKYKVVLPASNGSGAIGEVIPTPLIGEPIVCEPSVGFTQSFISFGAFEMQSEAEAACKYIKSKFARALLGTMKVTQHNHKGTWKNVPCQDFTSASDIDWSKSIHDIDHQLYRKYGLSDEEIAFIESHVKEMN